MSFIFDYETFVLDRLSIEEEITEELIDLVPTSWFSPFSKKPGGIFWALMSAKGQLLGAMQRIIELAKAQLRIKTATGFYLDVIGEDFFGENLGRKPAESDVSYRDRILSEILREKATVGGIRAAVEQLTGAPPEVFEAFNVRSVGCWTDLYNGAYAPSTLAAWGQNTLNQFQTAAFGSGGTTPQAGVGTYGDTENIYTFYVNILSNPKGATHVDIQALVDKLRGIGILGIVQGGV